MNPIRHGHSRSSRWRGHWVRLSGASLTQNRDSARSAVTDFSPCSPLLGGYLSNPVEQYPSLFGHSQFLRAYPYALPCLVGALFPFCGAVLGIFCLEETLKPHAGLPADETVGAVQPEPEGPRRRGSDSQRHKRFVSATSTTLPAPSEQVHRLEDENGGPDSGYSTPRSMDSSSRNPSPSNGAARRTKGAPTFRSMFTRRVQAALGVYVSTPSFVPYSGHS